MALLLMYHISAPKALQIQLLCARRRILTRAVGDSESGVPIGRLAGRNVPDLKAKSVPFSEEMLVLVDFTSQQLDDFLSSYRDAGISPVPLKAVMTEINMSWSASALCQELKREREEMMRRYQK